MSHQQKLQQIADDHTPTTSPPPCPTEVASSVTSELDTESDVDVANIVYRSIINRGLHPQTDTAPVAVDLFAGAGGASIGINRGGFNVVAAVDNNPDALHNHTSACPAFTIQHDLREVDIDILPTRVHEPVYVHGSPPCKGFSNANKDRGIEDSRNSLVFSFVEWVDALRPKIVTMENVTGMESISSNFMQKVTGAFREVGYETKYRTLNAADYGVPQTRKRIITIAVRDDVSTTGRWYPQPTHAEAPTTTLTSGRLREWVSVQDALDDLYIDVVTHRQQGDNNGTSEAVWRDGETPAHTVKGQASHTMRYQQNTRSSDQINDTRPQYGRRPLQPTTHPSNNIRSNTPPLLIPRSPPSVEYNDTISSPPAHLPNHDPRESTDSEPLEWESDEPSETLLGDARLPDKKRAPGDKSSHWEGSRRLTVRECARLQSFPDWMVFRETKTKQYEQIGNAVPPLLMEAIARQLTSLLAIGN